MLRSEPVRSALVVAPHADDEVLGCGGLLAVMVGRGVDVHVVYAAVDGSEHYGLAEPTTYAQRVTEIEAVAGILGFTWEVVYGDKDLMERLDTVPRRELVNVFQSALDTRRPDLLLLPCGTDYDQDHVAVFSAAFAAARPMPAATGKWLVPHVLTYEMTKIAWAAEPLPRATSYCDITPALDAKLTALRAYVTQLRADPHIRSVEAVTALAALRGKEVGVGYAEAFGVLRTLM